MKNALVAVLLVLFILTASTSCMLRMLQSPLAPTVYEEDQLPTSIAILPFVNKTANPEAGSLVRKMFYNFFSSLNYLDLEPYVIDDNLKTHHLYAGIIAGENISPQKLGRLKFHQQKQWGKNQKAAMSMQKRKKKLSACWKSREPRVPGSCNTCLRTSKVKPTPGGPGDSTLDFLI